MDTITLPIDNAPSIRFSGKKVAHVTSAGKRTAGRGPNTRWSELALYRTESGRFVCHQVGRSQISGERDRLSGKVCASAEEVQEFFGHRWLAMRLYEIAGIDAVVEIV